MMRDCVMASAENNRQIIVRFSLRDPKRDFGLTVGEAQSFKLFDAFMEWFFFRSRSRPVICCIHANWSKVAVKRSVHDGGDVDLMLAV